MSTHRIVRSLCSLSLVALLAMGGAQANGSETETVGGWRKYENNPVLVPDESWEKVAVMCPHVIWDDRQRLYRMWYSGGEQYEPDAIGYATSTDGLLWKKHDANPIFRSDPELTWEQDKVTACQVIPHGISAWERLPANPIISPGKDTWDGASCYKPFAIYEKQQNRWMLWYNGRRQGEHIGLAIHDGEDLGFGPLGKQGSASAVRGTPDPAPDRSGPKTSGILNTFPTQRPPGS